MNRKAFTLIELLVVIAIIAILAAILFPVFARAKLAGKKTAALSHARQIGTAVMLYVNDYDDVYPAATNITAGIHPIPGQAFPQLRTIVHPYVKNEGVWWLPGAARPGEFETVNVEQNLANAVAANGGIGPADDPDFLGAGTHLAYKARSTTGCPIDTPANCRGNISAQPSTAVDSPAGIWMIWHADSDYSTYTDGNRSPYLGAPDCRWAASSASKRQIAIYADGHANLAPIPRPQHWENMALDGKVYIPFAGCP